MNTENFDFSKCFIFGLDDLNETIAGALQKTLCETIRCAFNDGLTFVCFPVNADDPLTLRVCIDIGENGEQLTHDFSIGDDIREDLECDAGAPVPARIVRLSIAMRELADEIDEAITKYGVESGS